MNQLLIEVMAQVQKIVELVVLAIVMGAASLAGGLLPLKLAINPTKINFISVFSMGILISTSLVMIIPEGASTLYGSYSDTDDLESASRYMGLSMLGGFLLMSFIEGLPSLLSTFNISHIYDLNDPRSGSTIGIFNTIKSVFTSSLTLGLLLHGTIDGISLGSSFFASDASFQIVFFVAIVVHKLPTSFSLTSILIKKHLEHKVILVHLALFASTTPLASIATYFIISLTNSNNQFVIGILFLISAGSFLYVIGNVITNIANHSKQKETNEFQPVSTSSMEVEEPEEQHGTKLSGSEFGIAIAGMMIPVLMSLIGDI